FCKQSLEQQVRCLGARVQQMHKDPKKSSTAPFVKVLLKNLTRRRAELLLRCETQFRAEQKRRKSMEKRVMTVQDLQKCVQCLTEASCVRAKERACQALCNPS
ncbi:MAG: hypothetical protein AAGJ35_09025, partial [Myxococcota bacterium]